MKVSFKVPKAFVQSAQIKIESLWLDVAAISPLFKTNVSVSNDGTNCFFYINLDKTIQAAQYFDATPAAQPAIDFQPLDNPMIEVWNNFQVSTVATFKAGVTYLIPVTAYAPLNLIPDFSETVLIAGAAPAAGIECFRQTHFRYDCPADESILNGVNIANCIVVECDGALQAQSDAKRTMKTAAKMAGFGIATGNRLMVEQAKNAVS